MARGDHFFVWRQQHGVPFQHHGIDVGDGTAIHFTDGRDGIAGPAGSTDDFVIQQTSMDLVTRDGRDRLHFVQHQIRFSPDAVIDRARSRIGRQGYHVVFDNCEHFACWCVVAEDESRQINVACERLGSLSFKTIARPAATAAARFAGRRLVRGGPWMYLADAAQWITEAGGHHVGLRDPRRRKQAGRAVGATTALSTGALAGPAGVAIAGGLWVAGEFGGAIGKAAYGRIRSRRSPGYTTTS